MAENWQKKDMLYAVGIMNGENLQSLAFVYGDDYCADEEIYKAVKQRIKQGVETIEGVEFAETKELGRINKIDPLGITYLRVRGVCGALPILSKPLTIFTNATLVKCLISWQSLMKKNGYLCQIVMNYYKLLINMKMLILATLKSKIPITLLN